MGSFAELFASLAVFSRRVIRAIRGRSKRLYKKAQRLMTYVWRRLMFRTTVIAITGSVGKTTAKECLAAILEKHGRTLSTRYNQNDQYGVPPTIRRIRPWHRFAVVEVGTGQPGDIERSARLVKPDIAIVLAVARTHTNRFATLDDIAVEKAALLRHLPRNGLAILNDDDPRVAAMARDCHARTVLFGAGPQCDFRTSSPTARWPERLCFELTTHRDSLPCRHSWWVLTGRAPWSRRWRRRRPVACPWRTPSIRCAESHRTWGGCSR